nr:TonB-dependent receptor [Oleiagrimonas sp. C23AA]
MGGTGDLDKDGHNIYFSAEFEGDNAIRSSQRGFPYNTSDLTRIGGNNLDIGDPSNRSGSTFGTVTPATLATPGDLLSGQAIEGALYQPLRPCGKNSKPVTTAAGSYCEQDPAALWGQIQPKSHRAGIYGRFTQKLGDSSQIYVDALYYEDKVTSTAPPPQIQANTPVNTNSIALPPTLADGSLNPNNPFAAQGQYALINYAFGDIAGGAQTANHNLRITSGVTSQWDDWHLQGHVVLNHTWLDVRNYGFLNYDQLIKAVNQGTYNFIDPSKNSGALLQTLAPVLDKRSTTDLDSLDVQGTRELMDLPGGELGLALGAQWRYEAQRDPSLNPGSAAQGLGNAKTIGRRNVSSLYAELDAPVLSTLEVDLSGRYDHYSDFGNNFSPKVGFKWQPIDKVAIRGTYSKGFRAPSFSENGSSSAEGFVTYTPPASFVAQHGGPTNGYVKPYGLAEFTTANPNIKPEKSRSYTLGVLVQPTDSISASVDYYDIKKTGVIAQQSPDTALAAYYAGQPIPAGYTIVLDSPDPAYPNAPARPLIVEAPYINQNSLRTKGIDVDVQGTFALAEDVKLTSEISATKILSWTETLADGTVQRFVGTHGPYALSSGAGTPRYRASWSNRVKFGPATITGTLYYTSGLYNSIPDYLPANVCYSTGNQGQNIPSNCRLASFTDFDLTGSYRLTEHIELTASVLNLFDRKAPLDTIDYATASNYNPTWNQPGAIGRFYTLGVRVKFQ